MLNGFGFGAVARLSVELCTTWCAVDVARHRSCCETLCHPTKHHESFQVADEESIRWVFARTQNRKPRFPGLAGDTLSEYLPNAGTFSRKLHDQVRTTPLPRWLGRGDEAESPSGILIALGSATYSDKSLLQEGSEARRVCARRVDNHRDRGRDSWWGLPVPPSRADSKRGFARVVTTPSRLLSIRQLESHERVTSPAIVLGSNGGSVRRDKTAAYAPRRMGRVHVGSCNLSLWVSRGHRSFTEVPPQFSQEYRELALHRSLPPPNRGLSASPLLQIPYRLLGRRYRWPLGPLWPRAQDL